MQTPLRKGDGPISRQLYLWLRQAILDGGLRPGEALPSTRELAEQNSVSRTVVLLAYDQLIAEGFIEGRAGSGTYVSDVLRPARALRPNVARASAHVKLSPFGMAAATIAEPVPLPTPRPRALRYDFAYGRSSLGEFPLAAWRRILLRRARGATVRSFDYGEPAGNLSLREAIASHLRRSRAVICDASQVVIVNGSQQALDLTIRILLQPGDRVAIEDPQYQGTRQILLAHGVRLHPVPVDNDGLDPAKLPTRARAAFVTPSHQFPTGAVLPLGRRLALLEWARRANAVIVEDDYDGEFRYGGEPVEPLQGLDRDGRVIYIGTFSRTIFPALRIGYLIAPKSLVASFVAAKWLCDRHTAVLEQDTLAEFIESGAYERHLRRARKANALRRAALLMAVRTHLEERVFVTGERSGTHVVLWPRSRSPEETILARAASAEVRVYGISGYFLSPSSRVGLLLGYSTLLAAEIQEGIRRLGEIKF